MIVPASGGWLNETSSYMTEIPHSLRACPCAAAGPNSGDRSFLLRYRWYAWFELSPISCCIVLGQDEFAFVSKPCAPLSNSNCISQLAPVIPLLLVGIVQCTLVRSVPLLMISGTLHRLVHVALPEAPMAVGHSNAAFMYDLSTVWRQTQQCLGCFAYSRVVSHRIHTYGVRSAGRTTV